MNHLATLSRITDGREAELRARLEQLSVGSESPFTRIPTVHFARWVVIGRMPGAGRGFRKPAPPGAFLYFSASFDGAVGSFVEQLRSRAGEAADAVWRHCTGYPGSADAEAFRCWLLENEVNARYVVEAYPQATVLDIQHALTLRDQVVDFAAAAQELTPSEAAARFRAEF
jgi:hypothetical protein